MNTRLYDSKLLFLCLMCLILNILNILWALTSDPCVVMWLQLCSFSSCLICLYLPDLLYYFGGSAAAQQNRSSSLCFTEWCFASNQIKTEPILPCQRRVALFGFSAELIMKPDRPPDHKNHRQTSRLQTTTGCDCKEKICFHYIIQITRL